MTFKFDYYVGFVDYDGTIRFVTDIENGSRSWYSKAGQLAKTFKMRTAEEIAFGMSVNGTPAFVVKRFSGSILRNPKRED